MNISKIDYIILTHSSSLEHPEELEPPRFIFVWRRDAWAALTVVGDSPRIDLVTRRLSSGDWNSCSISIGSGFAKLIMVV